MDIFLRIDINLIATVLLGSVLLIAYFRLDMQDTINKAYMRISIIIILQLLVEAGTCVINRRQGAWLIPISYLLHLCLFTTAPILSYYGYALIRSLIYHSKEDSKWIRVLIIPVYLNAAITILSVKYNLIFYIDSSNVYHRGKYFLIFSVITYFYLLLSLILVFNKKNQIVKQEFIPLVLFSLFPTIGGLIQTIFYGPLLMWSSIAFSLVIIYVFLQERMVQLDDLTGAWTRGTFEFYIHNRLIQNSGEKIAVIYCDLDDFKAINDQFGHIEGDRAIKNTIKIIKNAIRKNDIVARMGGDEFIIILEQESNEMLDKTLDRIKAEFYQYNKSSGKNYKLDCSFGADLFDLNSQSIEEFLHHIDCLMYENKRSKIEIEAN
jgi:diguanylate cyclase (GGDEF)-like protein